MDSADILTTHSAARILPKEPDMSQPAPAPHPHACQHRTSSIAVLSMVFALVSPITCGLLAVPAALVGHLAWRRINERGEHGTGYAITGIVLGWTFTALFALIWISYAWRELTGQI